MGREKNSVLIDGFTLHAASLKDITFQEFKKLNIHARECLSTLIHALILHDTLIVGSEIIKPLDRYPEIFNLFNEAFIAKPIANELLNPEIDQAYKKIKTAYETLGRSTRYEEELVNFVQRMFFDRRDDPTDYRLRLEDPSLYGIFKTHQELRTRIYNLAAYNMGVPYLTSPYRKEFYVDYKTQGVLAQDILDNFIKRVREKIIEKVKLEWKSLPIDITTPPLVKFVFQEATHANIFKTVLEIRNSKIAIDFRTMCKEILTSDFDKLAMLQKELNNCADQWVKELHISRKTSKNVSAKILNLNIPIQLPDLYLGKTFPRKAFVFLYKLTKVR